MLLRIDLPPQILLVQTNEESPEPQNAPRNSFQCFSRARGIGRMVSNLGLSQDLLGAAAVELKSGRDLPEKVA